MNASQRIRPFAQISRKLTIFAGFCAIAFTAAQAQQGFQPPPPQDGPLRPGEAVVTRFSGVGPGGPQGATINTNGPVAVIIGVGAPQEPPQGQHWLNKPIRTTVTAGQVGQVFGVTIDDQNPPNIYLTATAAFGLHMDQSGWMPGMWGQGGGPGTVWRLDAASGYRNARPFADLRPNGRPNSAAALGNIAYDRTNRQFFVTDMETGLIHRIGPDGREGGTFDHGTDGRQRFTDAESRQSGSLPPIPFDLASTPRYQDCPGQFERTPACWNIAPSGRRVWGIGVRRDPMGQGARLYYGVWSGPDFGNAGWAQLSDEEKRNSVWSVRLGPGGQFDSSDVRREFVMPDFFNAPQDIERAGFSQPVSDIAFSECGERPVMLVSERGGMRNLGLTSENAFATPGEARTLRYELDQNGTWRAVGRYDVGNNDRQQQGAPFIRANCAGGAAFGPGVDGGDLQGQPGQQGSQPGGSGPDQFVWITGDNLCSPQAPCRLPGQEPQRQQASQGGQQGDPGPQPDPSQVHGVQGNAADLISEVSPASTYGSVPGQQGSQALENAYLVDVDTIVDPSGNLIEQELMRNDATHVGDIAIYQICAPPPPPSPALLIPPPPTGFVVPGHEPNLSHAQWASHGTRTSHFRFGSHSPVWSHQRWRSHFALWSHNPRQSHNPRWSHNRIESHNRWISSNHDTRRSHERFRSHFSSTSHNARISQPHIPAISLGHDRRLSWHNTRLSQGHNPQASQAHNPIVSNGGPVHQPVGSHNPTMSQGKPPHNPFISQGSAHNQQQSNAHNPVLSQGQRLPLIPGHNPVVSRNQQHNQQQSNAHNLQLSQGHRPPASPGHNPQISRVHNPTLSQQQHNPQASGVHNPVVSRAGPAHNPVVSRGPVHNQIQSRGPVHNPAVSRPAAHNAAASRGNIPRIQQPRFQQPRFQQPRIQQPRFQQPRVQQPRIQQPRFQQPRFQQPRVQQPRIQQPRFQQPRVQQPRQPVRPQQPQQPERRPVLRGM